MSSVKEFSVEEKLTSLVTLQKVESKLDEYKILKGELPMEVSDLEDEITGLHSRQTRVEEEINGIQEFHRGVGLQLKKHEVCVWYNLCDCACGLIVLRSFRSANGAMLVLHKALCDSRDKKM